MPLDPRRAKELFDRALDVPAEERRSFLDGACGEDAELRGLVDEWFSALDNAGEFLAEPGRPAALDEEYAGARIGRYKLLQEIGEGGFGTVWMAEQVEPVRRKVALKVIKLGMDTKQVVARFDAERQALALMDHPNIAKVFDGGTTPSGRPYFVMELIRGVPITDYCDQVKLALPERLKLFQQVCRAVQHAHQKGVIHRDLKPSNILVTLHDGVPVPKVIDFGIAKATSAELTQKTLFTEYGQIIGTPDYMAPEQAEMSGLDVDTRADVYSLGVLLYELLTGSKPFNLKTMLDQGYAEMLRAIREDDPPKPSTRVSTLGEAITTAAHQRHATPQSLSRLMRGDLDWIVMKALEKDRNRRYATAIEFAVDIDRYLTNEPVLASSPTAAYRLRKYVRRHRVGAIAASLVLLALTVGIGVAAVALFDAREQRDLAVDAEEVAVGERQAAVEARERAEEAEGEMRLGVYASSVQNAVWDLANNDIEAAQRRLETCPSSLRGWEWHYLMAQIDDSLAVAVVAAGRKCDFSDDGRSFSYEVVEAQRVRFSDDSDTLWATTSRGALALDGISLGIVDRWGDEAGLQGVDCERGVMLVLRETDGGSALKMIRRSGEETTLAEWPGKTVARTASSMSTVSRDGTLAVTRLRMTSQRSRVFLEEAPAVLWDLQTGARLGEFGGGALSFSRDCTKLAIADSNGIGIYDTRSCACIQRLKMPRIDADQRFKAFSIAWSHDGEHVAGGGAGSVTIWNTGSGDVETQVIGHELHTRWSSKRVAGLVFSPDGDLLISAAGTEVSIWNPETGQHLVTLRGHTRAITDVACSDDGKRIATTDGRQVRLWSTAARKAVVSSNARFFCLDHNEQRLIFSDAIAYDPVTAAPIDRFTRGWFEVNPILSPDGRWLAFGLSRLTVLDTSRPESTMRVLDSYSGNAGWNSSNLLLAVHERHARLWNPETESIVAEVDLTTVKSSRRVRVSTLPEIGWIVWDADGFEIWSDLLDRSIATLRKDGIESITPTADGVVVLGLDTGQILGVDALSGATVWVIEAGDEPILAIALSPDGSRLISTGKDRLLHVWEMASRSEVCAIPLDAEISQLDFDWDETLWAAGGGRVRALRTLPLYEAHISDRVRTHDVARSIAEGLLEGGAAIEGVLRRVASDRSLQESVRAAVLGQIRCEAGRRSGRALDLSKLAYRVVNVAGQLPGDYEDALECAREAYLLDPTAWGVGYTFGLALYRCGECREAIDVLRSTDVAASVWPRSAEYIIAMALWQQGVRGEAVALADQYDDQEDMSDDLRAVIDELVHLVRSGQ